MTAISVGIVSYNSAADLPCVLDSLLKSDTARPLSMTVADNASTDASCRLVRERYPSVTLVELPDNRGFGAAHNAVIATLTSDYHAIVNPDIEVEPQTLERLAAYLDAHPEAVLVTPMIRNADGSPQAVPRVLPKRRYMFAGQLERFGGVFRRWRDEYTRRRETFTAPTPITFCTGCFMMVRTDVLRRVGGFDDRFFMYMEDADLSRRLADYGELVLLPDVSVTHRWEKASGKSGKFLRIHLRSMRAYFSKWRHRR